LPGRVAVYSRLTDRDHGAEETVLFLQKEANSIYILYFWRMVMDKNIDTAISKYIELIKDELNRI
jgi:hypothetical protein